jgi:hypothetical protein
LSERAIPGIVLAAVFPLHLAIGARLAVSVSGPLKRPAWLEAGCRE